MIPISQVDLKNTLSKYQLDDLNDRFTFEFFEKFREPTFSNIALSNILGLNKTEYKELVILTLRNTLEAHITHNLYSQCQVVTKHTELLKGEFTIGELIEAEIFDVPDIKHLIEEGIKHKRYLKVGMFYIYSPFTALEEGLDAVKNQRISVRHLNRESMKLLTDQLEELKGFSSLSKLKKLRVAKWISLSHLITSKKLKSKINYKYSETYFETLWEYEKNYFDKIINKEKVIFDAIGDDSVSYYYKLNDGNYIDFDEFIAEDMPYDNQEFFIRALLTIRPNLLLDTEELIELLSSHIGNIEYISSIDKKYKELYEQAFANQQSSLGRLVNSYVMAVKLQANLHNKPTTEKPKKLKI